ncbi:hypothetical protein AB7M16_003350 [Bradyrhizobium sp. USDA 372]
MPDQIEEQSWESLSAEYLKSIESYVESEDGLKIYVDPVTTGILLLNAVGGLVSIIRTFSKVKLSDDVLENLSSIIRSVDTILKEIEALRAYIPVALDDAFRKRLTIDVQTQIDRFSIEIADLSDSDINKLSKASPHFHKIEQIAEDQLQNALNLRGYGYPGYFAVATAAISYLSIAAALKISAAKAKAFNTQIGTWFAQCIDPNLAGSAADVRNRLTNDANNCKNMVDGQPRSVWLGYYTRSELVIARGGELGPPDRPDRPERRTRFVNWYATQSGSFDAGLKWDPQQEVSDRPNPRGWPLIPTESSTDLHNGDNSAYARCVNNIEGINGVGGFRRYVDQGKDLFEKAKQTEATIATIKELAMRVDKATSSFK